MLSPGSWGWGLEPAVPGTGRARCRGFGSEHLPWCGALWVTRAAAGPAPRGWCCPVPVPGSTEVGGCNLFWPRPRQWWVLSHGGGRGGAQGRWEHLGGGGILSTAHSVQHLK